MTNHYQTGENLRLQIKNLVYDFMCQSYDCSSFSEGMKQAEIFRACGLDWGDYPNATSSNQQYWIVGLLRELETEHKVKRDPVTKKWSIV
ncbi:MAG: hypothetical protein U0L20_00010 [Ruminococcus sp.]|nr:hypothetical protein [Ruminococcus sp.]